MIFARAMVDFHLLWGLDHQSVKLKVKDVGYAYCGEFPRRKRFITLCQFRWKGRVLSRALFLDCALIAYTSLMQYLNASRVP